MRIESEDIKLELNNREAREIAYHIKRSLERSIDTHYVKTHHDDYNRGLEGHAKPLFEEQCREDINMMNRLMCCASGDSSNSLEKELWHYLEKSYEKENKACH